MLGLAVLLRASQLRGASFGVWTIAHMYALDHCSLERIKEVAYLFLVRFKSKSYLNAKCLSI